MLIGEGKFTLGIKPSLRCTDVKKERGYRVIIYASGLALHHYDMKLVMVYVYAGSVTRKLQEKRSTMKDFSTK